MIVATNGSRIIARPDDSSGVPILSLNSKPTLSIDNRAISQMNLKLIEGIYIHEK